MAIVKCKHCGNEISDRAAVCPGCGKSVIASPSIVCEECGTAYEGDKAACPNCGCPTPGSSDQSTRSDKPARPKNTKKIVAIAVAVLLVIALAGGVTARQILLQQKYDRAIQLLDNDNSYEYAVQAFTELGDYKDSSDKVAYLNEQIRLKGIYDQALPMLEDETQYEEALKLFSELGDFKDSAEKAVFLTQQIQNEESYIQGYSLLGKHRYEEALPVFESLGDYKDSANITKALLDENYLYFLDAGDIYVFGSYEQDGSVDNGSEPIAWFVLEKQDDRALLLSTYVLDCMGFHEDWKGATWENSSVRTWLNDTFISTAFTAEQQDKILLTQLSTPKNRLWGTDGGNDTEDKVFLLSMNEVEKYFAAGFEPTVRFTTYAYQEHERKDTWGIILGGWWLRTPAAGIDRPVYGWMNGDIINRENNFGCDAIQGIRPAMWVSF